MIVDFNHVNQIATADIIIAAGLTPYLTAFVKKAHFTRKQNELVAVAISVAGGIYAFLQGGGDFHTLTDFETAGAACVVIFGASKVWYKKLKEISPLLADPKPASEDLVMVTQPAAIPVVIPQPALLIPPVPADVQFDPNATQEMNRNAINLGIAEKADALKAEALKSVEAAQVVAAEPTLEAASNTTPVVQSEASDDEEGTEGD